MSNIHPTAIIDDEAEIYPSSKISAFTIIRGKVKINKNCIVGRTLYLKRMSKYRESVYNHRSSKLSVLDPLNALCGDTKCFSKIKGKFLYADDDHFSKFGSIYIANYFQNEIFD